MATRTVFEVDPDTLQSIAALRDKLGVKSNEEVLSRALRLLRFAVASTDDDSTLTIKLPDGKEQKIAMNR